jgi:bleomycin hydrolase
MGSYQSKLPADATAHEKAVLDRLRTLQLEKRELVDDEYDYISDGSLAEKACGAAKSRQPETISVAEMEKWQDALLDDPKNR